jgi:tRNA-dihydrouridine synthase B
MLSIGTLKLKSRFILAPMASVSDLPFRLLGRRFGCELAFVEMLNVRSVSHKSVKTRQMLTPDRKDRPLGFQILAKEPQYILPALEVLKKYHFDLLDFNAACPERKVTRRGEGASLLKDPKKLASLLKLVVNHTTVPVTVKIRIGWDKHSINAKDVALYAQDAGVKALFIHGRTKEQGYAGSVDYAAIKKVKDALSVPVIASGDIFSIFHAQKMFEETGCDALLMARGALGNPWIFRECEAYFKDGTVLARPTRQEIALVMHDHLFSSIDFYGERNGVIIFRKFFAWYSKGFRKVRHLREQSCRAKTAADMQAVFDEFAHT